MSLRTQILYCCILVSRLSFFNQSVHADRLTSRLASRLLSAWTKGILTSSLASDPSIGKEVVVCVQAFLDVRQTYLASLRPAAVSQLKEDSQDEFGAAFDDLELDFDDPDVCRLFGDSEVSDTSPAAEAKKRVAEMEQTFARVVREDLSPAIYRLLSNMLTDGLASGPGMSAKEKEEYVDQLVDCWAGAASVLVQRGDQVRRWTTTDCRLSRLDADPTLSRFRRTGQPTSDSARSLGNVSGMMSQSVMSASGSCTTSGHSTRPRTR